VLGPQVGSRNESGSDSSTSLCFLVPRKLGRLRRVLGTMDLSTNLSSKHPRRSIPSVHQPIPAYSHIYHGTVKVSPRILTHPSPIASKHLQVFSCTRNAHQSTKKCDPYNLEMHWRPSKCSEPQIPSLCHNIPSPLRSVRRAPSRSYRHHTQSIVGIASRLRKEGGKEKFRPS
jgi:hypothetical protein